MKRVPVVLLLLALCLPPAHAAEQTPSFTDVSLDDWFAPYVEVCANAGVMKGVEEGRFAPEKELTSAECRALAYRLYDLRRGGNGAIRPAPENWGYMTLTVDGKIFEGYTDPNQESPVKWGIRGHNEWSADGSDYPGYSLPAAFLSPECATWAWSIQNTPATMTLNGEEYSGTASYGTINDTTVQISFLPDNGEQTAGLLADAICYAFPAPGNWWRDIAYTLSSQELRDMFGVSTYYYAYDWEGPASRKDLAHMLNRSAGELEPINSIAELPDCTDEEVRNLYRAGILTGTDPYGSFQGEKGLTRAEAAAMIARILDPSLRIFFAPIPLPTEGYTLTYLMDGVPDCGIDYPICLVGDVMLTLDGRQLPWPAEAAVPSHSLWPSGDYCHMGFYDLSTEDPYDTKAGLIDRNGVYVVPPENGRGITYAVEGGFFTNILNERGINVWGLLDEQGRWIRELERADSDPRDVYPPKERNSFRGIDWNGFYYVDATGTSVSQPFNWGSHITDDGRGFVGMDGNVYRIEFQK